MKLADYIRVVGDKENFNFYNKVDHNGNTYTVGNYISIIAKFPPITEEGISDAEREDRRLLRDMRGIIFDKDGNIISRPFHKFMNLNEGIDHAFDAFDWTDFTVFDKLDGSMLRPVNFYGDIRWCTKAGITNLSPDVEAFVARNPIYAEFAQEMLNRELTPIFEYLAPKYRIVVNYGPVEKLVLLAIRDNISGAYLDIHKLCPDEEIPKVAQWEVESVETLLKTVTDLQNAEGVIIKFKDGRWIKVKSLQYVDLHKSRDAMERERFVIYMTLKENLDDMLPLIPDFIQSKIVAYADGFMKTYKTVTNKIVTEIMESYARCSTAENPKKEFALTAQLDQQTRSFAFTCWPSLGTPEAEDILRAAIKERVCNWCDSSEANFKEHTVKMFPDRPDWNIWEVTEG